VKRASEKGEGGTEDEEQKEKTKGMKMKKNWSPKQNFGKIAQKNNSRKQEEGLPLFRTQQTYGAKTCEYLAEKEKKPKEIQR
jgi:hypothetical protein